MSTRYTGNDNHGQPKSAYIERLAAMTEQELRKACSDKIWLSAYASNNPRSDYHWQCDAVYDECVRRGRVDIYSEEHAKLCRG